MIGVVPPGKAIPIFKRVFLQREFAPDPERGLVIALDDVAFPARPIDVVW